MKVAIYIDPTVESHFGGGFSYVMRLTAALCERARATTGAPSVEYCLLFHHPGQLVDPTLVAGIPVHYVFKEKPREMRPARRTMSRLRGIAARAKGALGVTVPPVPTQAAQVHEAVRAAGIDVIYYTHQIRCLEPTVPFIATHWDLAHVLRPSFPEVAFDYERRAAYFRNVLPRALRIFAESEAGKDELVRHLRIPADQIRVVPLIPGGVIEMNVPASGQAAELESHGLGGAKYFFYPAQFWAIKNHYGLVQAFHRCRARTEGRVRLVFCGGDKGTKDYIQRIVTELGLQDSVSDLGFVSDQALHALYRNALALVMPTVLGPTNMPVLEAMCLDCPVLCSDFPGHREQAGDAACYFEPTDHAAMAALMDRVWSDAEFRRGMIDRGRVVAARSVRDIGRTVELVDRWCAELAPLRACWGNG